MSNTSRITKNTLMLYFRQILVMLVSLYTVRVVLETLSAEDYGIYNIVAGVVTMFGFLSNSMTTATQRYLSFELGRNDYEQLKKVFSLTLFMYILIALFVLLLAETLGLWFVNHKLVIPPARMPVVQFIYQLSIFSFLCSILTAPYMVSIIAHEDMGIYASISILEVLLKLGAVFLLSFISFDKLQLHGILICSIGAITMMLYLIICKRKYQECKLVFFWNKSLFKEITSFFGWNLFGNLALICKNQGISILLNIFFGPIINATRAISLQVNNAVSSFFQNFMTAVRPQITKEYAAQKYDSMINLVFRSSKFSYLLMLILSIPLLFEMPYIIKLWLKEPPPYSVIFVCFTLIDTLFDSISYPILYITQATGKIKCYQLVVNGMLLLNLPISYIVLKMGFPPYTVMIVAITLIVVTFFLRLIIIKRLMPFPVMRFCKYVILPISVISVLSIILPFMIVHIFTESFFRLCCSFILSIAGTMIGIYFIGLTKNERNYINGVIQYKIFRSNRKKYGM